MRGSVLTNVVLAVALGSTCPARASVLAGTAPDPDDADLVLWLKADSLELSDGAPVERWRDSSRRGRDMLGGRNGAGLPQFATDVLNGLPALRFDGSRQTMALEKPVAVAQRHTIIVVGRARSELEKHSDTFVSFCAAAPPAAPRAGDGGLAVYYANGKRRFRMSYRGALDTRKSIAQPASALLDGPAILVQVRSSDRNARAYIDDPSAPWLNVTTSPSPAVATPKYVRLGALDEPASNLNGEIFEVLIYNRALSPVELREVADYLQQKWLPSAPRRAQVLFETQAPAAASGAVDQWYRDRGSSGFDLLDGAIEFFLHSKLASSAWRADSFVPLALDGGPRGLSLSLRSTGPGALQVQLQVHDPPQRIVAEATGLALAANELHHFALTLSTDPASGAVGLRLYAAPGNTSIDTTSSNFELARASGPALQNVDHAFAAPLDFGAARGLSLARARIWRGIPRRFAAFETYPDLANVRVPEPEPAYPESFDPFAPPVSSTAPIGADAPAIAEWTRSGVAGDSLVLTGDKLSAFSGRDEGKDSEFLVYGQNGEARALERAQLHRLRDTRAAIQLDDALPRSAMYLIWPRNQTGYGRPVALNQTEAWWVGPDRAAPGARVSLYGRNLAHAGGTSTAFIYLKPVGRANGQFITPSDVNPYKVDFNVPGDLAAGSYEVWAHNGHGRRYGWGKPLLLTVDSGIEWTGQTFEPEAFGARGDDEVSDTAAIQATLDAAGREATTSGRRTTVRFPAGTFVLTDTLNLPGNVRILGAGKDATRLLGRGTYSRVAHIIWMGHERQPNEIGHLTLDSGSAQSGNGENPFVLAGTATDTRFHDLRLIALTERMWVVYLTSTRTSFTDCDFIGKQVLVNRSQQVHFERCNFYGMRDGVVLSARSGTEQFSVTHCTARDYDASGETYGWTQGRFLNIVNGSRLSRDIYVADNVTHDLAVHPSYLQNTGEQISWDEAKGQFIASPLKAENQLVRDTGSVSFASPPPALDADHTLLAAVVDGKGVGQVRDVTRVDGKGITVAPAWNVVPDRSSRIALGSYHTRAVVYRNQLDGKAAQVARSVTTASAGVVPYGAVSQVVVDSNLVTDCRGGIGAMGQAIDRPEAPLHMLPSMFHLYANNSIENSVIGMQFDATGNVASQVSSFGYVLRGNTIDTTQAVGVQLVMNTQGRDLDMFLLDRSLITNARGVLGIAYTLVPPAPPSGALMLLNNYFDRGDAPFADSYTISGPQTRDLLGLMLRANKRRNDAGLTRGSVAWQTPELPVRVFSVAARAAGKPVSFPMTVYNVGATNMAYRVTQVGSWLGVSENAGTTDGGGETQLTVTCDPRGLPVGTYRGTIYVAAGGITRAASVRFRVLH